MNSVQRGLGVAVLLLVGRLAGAALPGPAKDVYTQHQFMKSLHEFNRRTLVEPYKKVGKHDPKWDEDAIKFLEGMSLRFSNGGQGWQYQLEGMPDTKTLLAMGEAARGKGCDDPMVAYCYATVLGESERSKDAQPILEKAISELFQSSYPPVRLMNGAGRLYRSAVDEASKEAAWKKFVESAAATLSSVDPQIDIDRRMILRYVFMGLNGHPPERWKQVIDAAEKTQKADEWCVNVLAGEYHIEAGWAERGKGTADTVTEKGWKVLGENLAKSRQRLVAAWKAEPNFPEAPSAMITVAMAGGDHEPVRTWFDRATAGQIDYMSAYSRYVNAILPRWGGSTREMHDFGVECAKTLRFDTAVPWQFCYVMEQIASDTGSWQIWSQPGVLDRVQEVCEGYAKNPKAKLGENPEQYNYLSYAAAVAWAAGDYPRARKQLDAVGEHVSLPSFAGLRVAPQLAYSHVYAVTSPWAAELKEAEQAGDKNLDEGIALFRKLIEPLGKDDKARYYVRSWLKGYEWKKAFDAGEWVDLQPEEDFAGWSQIAGTWTRGKDGIVTGKVDSLGLMLMCQANFMKGRFEVEATIEVPDAPQTSRMGLCIAPHEPFTYYGFWLQRDADGDVGLINEMRKDLPVASEIRKPSLMRIIVWDDKLSVHANDTIYPRMKEAEYYVGPPGLTFGVGGRDNVSGLELKLKSIRLRKAKQEPPKEGR